METFFYKYPNPVDNKNAGIEIRKEHELSQDELFLLKRAGLDSYAPLEAWTALWEQIRRLAIPPTVSLGTSVSSPQLLLPI